MRRTMPTESGIVRCVNSFSEFRGLSGSAKQKLMLENMGLAPEHLSRLVVNNAVDAVAAAALLGEMKRHSKQVKPAMLGVIGRDHFEARFKAAGCEMESFDYRKIEDYNDEGIPFLIEVAFGWLGDNARDERRLVTRVNWSPGILNPFRRLGAYGQSLDNILSQQRVDRDEPVIFVLHAACPRVDYLDRGKSSVAVRS
jgi:DNA topoisomerase VI subunit B